jgi:hypothetical protein
VVGEMPAPLHFAKLAILFLFAAGSLSLALLVPYHNFDAFVYGEWSHLIALTGEYHFRTTTELMSHRPFFYFLQGWLWRFFGFDERFGRILGLLFSVILVYFIFRLARNEKRGTAEGWIAIILLLCCQDFVTLAFSGLTDVPVAALVACAGACLWTITPSTKRSILLLLISASAALTKPSAFPALAGLGLAYLIGPRALFFNRMIKGCVPILFGLSLALLYDSVQAERYNISLIYFLRGEPEGGYYQTLSATTRVDAILNAQWLGPNLKLLLIFTLFYSLLRIAGTKHRLSSSLALPLSVIFYWLGPWLACEKLYSPLIQSLKQAILIFILSLPVLLFTLSCPEELAPSRERIARLLLWSSPTLAIWLISASYDTRLLSPAWVSLLLLIGSIFSPVFLGKRVAITLSCIMLLALFNFRNLDGMGIEGWRKILQLIASRQLDQDSFREAILSSFGGTLKLARQEMKTDGRIFTNDPRFRLFFPGRCRYANPKRCSVLKNYRLLILSKIKDVREIKCDSPKLILIHDFGDHSIYKVEGD